MGFFNNLFNIKKARTVTKTVSAPYVPPYPLEKDFYTFDKVEWSGALPPHSMTLSFVLPYSDWCEFEKSDLYRDLENYLQELQKRGNPNENVDRQMFIVCRNILINTFCLVMIRINFVGVVIFGVLYAVQN